jgi:hypothetical protein
VLPTVPRMSYSRRMVGSKRWPPAPPSSLDMDAPEFRMIGGAA